MRLEWVALKKVISLSLELLLETSCGEGVGLDGI